MKKDQQTNRSHSNPQVGSDVFSEAKNADARQFDFLEGEWDAICRFPLRDGCWGEGRGWLTASKVLDGCVSLEFFEGPYQGTIIKGLGLRAFNPQTSPQKLHRRRGLGARWKGGRDERCDGVKARCEGKRVELRHTSSRRREGQKESASFALQQGAGAASPATSEPPERFGNRVAQHASSIIK